MGIDWITKVGIQIPIIQAGMAGGPTTPQLVASVSNAGGLGTLGAGYMKPGDLRDAIRQTKLQTEKPFAVNLFIPEKNNRSIHQEHGQQMEKALQKIRLRLGLAEQTQTQWPQSQESLFEQQMEVVINEEVPVFSFTFGRLSQEWINLCKQAGIYMIGTATSVHEAEQLEKSGVDAVVAQGYEAGGHRGTFDHAVEEACIGSMALLPQVVDAVQIPVIAAGGLMDGRGVAAAFLLGAQAVQMGTAFLTCYESGAHPAYQEKLLQAEETDTRLTKIYSGKSARGLITAMMNELADLEDATLPYPIQNEWTRDIRNRAAQIGNVDYMSLWAGQGIRLQRRRHAAELVSETWQDALHRLDDWGKIARSFL
ncbi:NAD(P)H-dependent flavin oxidoreductase [Alicyclobacillus tolerans]|uniref:NAD(P)H-dependent flavin oxidoreductase n=1 Tax=Alicyclobacillus tolerans TaxID=90970 RepID=UPI003B764F1C